MLIRRWKYLWKALLGLDRFGNTLLGGRDTETISSRVGRQQEVRWWGRLVPKWFRKHADKSEGV